MSADARKRGAPYGLRHPRAVKTFEQIEAIRDEYEYKNVSATELATLHKERVQTIHKWVTYQTRAYC